MSRSYFYVYYYVGGKVIISRRFRNDGSVAFNSCWCSNQVEANMYYLLRDCDRGVKLLTYRDMGRSSYHWQRVISAMLRYHGEPIVEGLVSGVDMMVEEHLESRGVEDISELLPAEREYLWLLVEGVIDNYGGVNNRKEVEIEISI